MKKTQKAFFKQLMTHPSKIKKKSTVDKYFIRNYSYLAWLIVLGLLTLLVDFLSKAYIYHVLPFYDSCTGLRCFELPVFRGFLGIDFSIGLVFNRGAAWGLFSNFQWVLLCARILMILALFLYLFFVNYSRAANAPLVLIVAGAMGNVVDFFLYGVVIDFLQFNFWGYNFPVFNLADTFITMGVVWLLFISIYEKNKKKYA